MVHVGEVALPIVVGQRRRRPEATGRVGVGAGATVGKWAGREFLSPGGVGIGSVSRDGESVSAIAVIVDAAELFGTRGLVKIRGAIDGEPFDGALMAQGDGTHRLPVKAKLREAIGKRAGDTVRRRAGQHADEAVERGAQLLLAHHPLLLRGVNGVPADDPKGALVHKLIRNRAALYCAHTNADSALQRLACHYLGGKALPIWSGKRPAWIPEGRSIHWAVIALLDYGPRLQ